MKVSCVMSVFNAEKYLSASVESILNQNYTDFEFIIVDDGSADRSLEILQGFAGKDSRIKLIVNGQNSGLTKNLNKAIALAQGEFIARMDADDISLPNRFERQSAYLIEHPEVDILGTFSSDINEAGSVVGKRNVPVEDAQIKKMLPKINPMSHPTVMYRKASLSRIGFYDEKFRTSQDYDLWFRAAGAGLVFHNLPETLFYYRMNEKYVRRKNLKYRLNDIRIKRRGYKLLRLPFYMNVYILASFILGIIPAPLFNLIKKFDPRRKIKTSEPEKFMGGVLKYSVFRCLENLFSQNASSQINSFKFLVAERRVA